MKHEVSYSHLASMCVSLASRLERQFPLQTTFKVYGVPRGGVSAALAMGSFTHLSILPVNHPEEADFILDDLIDSGRTMEKFKQYGLPFHSLIDKRNWTHGNDWVIWPWEETAEKGVEDNITRLLQYVGEDPMRGGLLETPHRVAKAWKFWCKGYDEHPQDILKTFDDGAENVTEMVIVKDIPFYTHCEHHLAPFFGTATIAYIPDGKIVGLSKLNRVLDCYARRLQVQERLTTQVADALWENLSPHGVGVVIKARHMCMESRGVCQQGHHTITSALRGVMLNEPEARAEFLQFAR